MCRHTLGLWSAALWFGWPGGALACHVGVY